MPLGTITGPPRAAACRAAMAAANRPSAMPIPNPPTAAKAGEPSSTRPITLAARSVIRSAIAASPPKYRDGPLARNESIPGSVISTLRYQRGDRSDDVLEPSGIAIGIVGDEPHIADSTPGPGGGADRRRCLLAPLPATGRSPGCRAAPRPVHRLRPARQRPPSSGTTTPRAGELLTASSAVIANSLFDRSRPADPRSFQGVTVASGQLERCWGGGWWLRGMCGSRRHALSCSPGCSRGSWSIPATPVRARCSSG